jgi:hypothetical protein
MALIIVCDAGNLIINLMSFQSNIFAFFESKRLQLFLLYTENVSFIKRKNITEQFLTSCLIRAEILLCHAMRNALAWVASITNRKILATLACHISLH